MRETVKEGEAAHHQECQTVVQVRARERKSGEDNHREQDDGLAAGNY